MSYLRHIENCNTVDWECYIPFVIDGVQFGYARREYVPVFAGMDAFDSDGVVLSLSDKYTTPHDRTAFVRDCLAPVVENGDLPHWWGEDYPVVKNQGDTPAFCIDRTFVPFLGVRAWGVHLNGYVVDGSFDDNGDNISMWIGRRAPDKKHYPNMLDNMVAGGQPFGITPDDNMKKEMAEEAGIPTTLHPALKRVGEINYTYTMNWTDTQGRTWHGVRPDGMITYDLQMPHDIIPTPVDGEVAEFMCLPMGDILDIIKNGDDFKFNCNLVILDFAIRNGMITPDNTPEYHDLVVGLGGG